MKGRRFKGIEDFQAPTDEEEKAYALRKQRKHLFWSLVACAAFSTLVGTFLGMYIGVTALKNKEDVRRKFDLQTCIETKSNLMKEINSLRSFSDGLRSALYPGQLTQSKP